MKPRQYSSEAIVLARRNFSEADRILVVYSKYYGKLSLLAKGVRKPKSRKRGALEVFSHIKFSAARGKSLDLVTETELINPFNLIRENLKKTSVAYFLLEVTGRLTRDDEKDERLFQLLLNYLKKLEVEKSLRKLREDFIYQSLILLGFWPRGKKMDNPDQVLENVVEREMTSVRVGIKMLS